VCGFWQDLEQCAMSAIRQPGNIFKTRGGNVKFTRLKHFLICQLPSGRTISYFGAFIGSKKNPWTGRDNPALKYYASLGKSWVICDTYGGSLAENVTQAVAADVLIGGIVRTEAAGMPVVLHVHDEIVTENPVGLFSKSDLESLMTFAEPWMMGLPVAAKGWTGARYQK
jgi:DNA polymerase bacteriophage-type